MVNGSYINIQHALNRERKKIIIFKIGKFGLKNLIFFVRVFFMGGGTYYPLKKLCLPPVKSHAMYVFVQIANEFV